MASTRQGSISTSLLAQTQQRPLVVSLHNLRFGASALLQALAHVCVKRISRDSQGAAQRNTKPPPTGVCATVRTLQTVTQLMSRLGLIACSPTSVGRLQAERVASFAGLRFSPGPVRKPAVTRPWQSMVVWRP
jgi:hypothetical protein